MFAPCLHASVQPSACTESALRLRLGIDPQGVTSAEGLNDVDVAFKNLIGAGASEAAKRWANHEQFIKKLANLREHLGPNMNGVPDSHLGVPKLGRLMDYRHIPHV